MPYLCETESRTLPMQHTHATDCLPFLDEDGICQVCGEPDFDLEDFGIHVEAV